MFDSKQAAILLGTAAVVWKLSSKDDIVTSPLTVSSGNVQIRWNGNGSDIGFQTMFTSTSNLDDLIKTACASSPNVQEIVQQDENKMHRMCNPANGAKLFSGSGRRIVSSKELLDEAIAYIVPQGLQFVYPLNKVGDVIFPTHVQNPIPGKPIKMTQLAMAPRAFAIDNFISDQEIEEILERNTPSISPSEVGYEGTKDNSQRNSSTAWDHGSSVATAIQKRAFQLAGIDYDPNMADALQVLRYKETEWYKAHLDSFDNTGYDAWNPAVENGTNRFATVFIYLSDVEEGGNTVFPLSTTHQGYNGEMLVHDGTVKSPGYIAVKDNIWVCNSSSTALRSQTTKGHVVLFYSQGPDSSIDPYSLHGGCPPVKGVKWSANVWLWNRPKPNMNERGKAGDQIAMSFQNDMAHTVELLWDDGTPAMLSLGDIAPGESMPMNTYDGHRFVALMNGVQVLDFKASKAQPRGKRVVIQTPSASHNVM